MSNEERLKTFFREHYAEVDEISDTTPVTEITHGDKHLGVHLKDTFGTQPSIKEEQDFDTFEDVLKWLNGLDS
ncbi:hypothetical protein F3J44_09505 [Pantoea sp. Tr-811]|uniref:hypothetical protein n=1 Tax=Pantoea sp. Tr-811 TaxID=2608361 RepID=UPI00142092ED|nr:hypothetical protein [Pantoea sp. Tr-811]NIF26622.1 hypothetical protein [Pantoea sp. Tr-811]